MASYEKVVHLFKVELKDKQKEILDSILGKRHTLAVLPTGYGKSLPYQVFVPAMRERLGEREETPKAVVCCPLVALMEDQVNRLNGVAGLRVEYKGNSAEGDERIKAGDVDFIFASPEALVGDPQWRSHIQKLNVGLLVIDEFHTIARWGGDETDEEEVVFRRWFRHVREFRTLHPSATVLALSATCTTKIKNRVMKVMCLKSSDINFVSVSPDKPNIKLCVKKIDHDIASAMYWLVSAGNSSILPKILIYCKSIADVANVFHYLHSELDNKSQIEMFHSETPSEKKKFIIEQLSRSDSEVKIIVATSALGMGIDIAYCHSVILYGPPTSIVDFVQELGRVGRDGQPSSAIILYSYQHKRRVDKDVRQFLDSKDCRRRNLLSHFLEELTNCIQNDSHVCCDICEVKCNCGRCEKTELETLLEINECVECEDVVEDSDTDTDLYYNEDELSDDGFYASLDDMGI